MLVLNDLVALIQHIEGSIEIVSQIGVARVEQLPPSYWLVSCSQHSSFSDRQLILAGQLLSAFNSL